MNQKLENYISVGFFAFFGGALRCLMTNLWAQTGTFLANVVGCFILAFLTYFFLEFREGRDWLATGLSTGFVGSFTTFSSFHLDALKQLQQTNYQPAIIYFFGSIILGLMFATWGMYLGDKLGKKMAGAK